MVINKKASKTYKFVKLHFDEVLFLIAFVEVNFVELLFVGIGLVSSIISSRITTESLKPPEYLPPRISKITFFAPTVFF